ncbi:hypothetical protein C8A05DRAFT_41199 [Staphylotrichum tortipilum]|uniref:non-specific serine/threonine protein kinase n=1 Tax=Staphylotrichum tortipilum TaxID=2831512 RepID=A0AAN6MRT5_9PEZI|nr:hypothetical protein C8A05DRAFT_41199 [Staphylotrichum longicolle]
MTDQPQFKIINDNPIGICLATSCGLLPLPLLNAALADHLDHSLIWERVYDALRNTGSFANSSEHRKYMDNVLKEELGPMYIDLQPLQGSARYIQDFHKAYFGSVPNLPDGVKQNNILSWFTDFSDKLVAFTKRHESAPKCRRRLLAKPDEPISGSVVKRNMDIGFASAEKDSGYAREVLAVQDTCRFVLGFTLCGSLMRVWVFDRLGGIASEQFDINKDELRFVSTILGFLWMSEEELGFDLTVMAVKGQRFIEIERDGTTERLILDSVMKRARYIAGRATTCWKVYREGDPDALFVVKDSLQYPECDDEGGLLREVTGKGVVRVARYYYHETVRVRNAEDDAVNYQEGRSRFPSTSTVGPSRASRSSSIARTKRSSDQTGAPLPSSKRYRSTSPTKASSGVLPNWVHRRVILSDCGIPIYKAGSRQALLGALADCIEGHESLRQKADLLHRDISIGNLIVDKDNRGFVIDLDLAIRAQRVGASEAKGKTGTRAFMAIGAILGEQHSFMHDLESFFWVLFWRCIHCDGPGESKLGTVSDADVFRNTTEEFFKYYRRLIPWVNTLRKAVFPGGGRWKREDSGLYAHMRKILEEARKDPRVAAEAWTCVCALSLS